MKVVISRVFIVIVALFLIVIAIGFGTAIGEISIPFSTMLKALANGFFNANYAIDKIDEGIIWNYRLNRAIVGACCGASLSLCGVILQSLLRNPLADPYILGLSAGASTGAVAVTIWGLGAGFISMSFGAFTGAILAFLCVALLALKSGRSPTAIILSGVAGAQLFNALTALIVTKWADAEAARGIMFWLLGNLSAVRWSDAYIALPATLVAFFICLFHTRALDAFTFGSQSAGSLGVSIMRIYIILIGICAFLTAIMVSMVGAIGFVGLVIPHVARFLVGVRHGVLIPMSAFIGAIFMIICDIVSRTLVTGQVIPIGVITALIGAPAFAIILARKNGNMT
ncbi:FecCD family ABC transporter permease [Bartonella tamiae]|uniref:ABC transporter permease n=1 Tax=Bartonella tamiae Th239 TaxID=1094558 RepID=J0ZL81_9HYPH|nr:iron chelate uptake ABC transporter family permease subunit [Bartonella tamiae]EJF89163.1 hypothetical protein ME5_01714 [Bartonella tamiae Th239]EJF95434.1 hypothetical protein MEG_00167 [Bartonella tamiae Th307]